VDKYGLSLKIHDPFGLKQLKSGTHLLAALVNTSLASWFEIEKEKNVMKK
jgi:hypothetical protein